MVTLTYLMEQNQHESSLLCEATGSNISTSVIQNHQQEMESDLSQFFLSRTKNFGLSVVLLVGCYLAILIPAYLPSEKLTSIDVHQQPKDLVLLNRSAYLLSGPCQPEWCLDHLRHLSYSPALLDIPVFVVKKRRALWERAPPMGLQGSEQHLAKALAFLPEPGLPPLLEGEGNCRRCVVVGSGGVLHRSHLGSHIDQYDIIIRLNNAPVSGFEVDTGSSTTIRLVYPEGAPHSPNEYRDTTMVTLVVFKSLDLDWLSSIITKRPLSFWSKLWFWREVVEDIPLRAENFRILNPEIIHQTGQALQSYTPNKGKILPTLGACAIVMALQLCDHVSLAGFGYDMQHPGTRLHYYETLRMDAMKAQVVHDISVEKLFLRDLVASGVVTDLTGAI